jgi:hypothetical protein
MEREKELKHCKAVVFKIRRGKDETAKITSQQKR